MKISTCSNYDNTQLKEYNNNKVSHNWEVREVAWEKEAIVALTTEYGRGVKLILLNILNYY